MAYELGGDRIERDTRQYTIPFGGWKEVLDKAGWVGAIDRMEPVETALAALAACINVGISLNALANGVDLHRLEVLCIDQDLGAHETGLFPHRVSARPGSNRGRWRRPTAPGPRCPSRCPGSAR